MQENLSVNQSFLPKRAESLRVNLSPHFFFNILNSIYHSIKLNPDQAEDILLKFSELMRYYIYDCLNEKIMLEKEVRNIRNFIALQKMRMPFELKEDFLVEGEIGNQLISPSVFMEVVENVFQHGLNDINPQSFFEINFSILDHQVIFNLSYSCSQDVDNHSEKYDKGLMNLQSKLHILYPASHYFQINKSDKACSIFLQIQTN
ncbi:MAG TPA: histidine kinase [Chitinophagales bacterium]|nr:histidine kinase [Chitinophagales bacterium]